ncbi:MAG: hypothetical protein IIV13_02445 [Bacteroidaceae bacterium]|nr:hypothetical protein [Bacteroidaceae bacterium]
MLKRVGSLVVLLAFILAIPTYAASPRQADVQPNITFANNNATCTLEIYADRSNDRISATMELWQGTQKIDTWNTSDSGYLFMEETARVEANKTYKLVVNYSINGIAKNPMTIYRTNS